LATGDTGRAPSQLPVADADAARGTFSDGGTGSNTNSRCDNIAPPPPATPPAAVPAVAAGAAAATAAAHAAETAAAAAAAVAVAAVSARLREGRRRSAQSAGHGSGEAEAEGEADGSGGGGGGGGSQMVGENEGVPLDEDALVHYDGFIVASDAMLEAARQAASSRSATITPASVSTAPHTGSLPPPSSPPSAAAPRVVLPPTGVVDGVGVEAPCVVGGISRVGALAHRPVYTSAPPPPPSLVTSAPAPLASSFGTPTLSTPPSYRPQLGSGRSGALPTSPGVLLAAAAGTATTTATNASGVSRASPPTALAAVHAALSAAVALSAGTRAEAAGMEDGHAKDTPGRRRAWAGGYDAGSAVEPLGTSLIMPPPPPPPPPPGSGGSGGDTHSTGAGPTPASDARWRSARSARSILDINTGEAGGTGGSGSGNIMDAPTLDAHSARGGMRGHFSSRFTALSLADASPRLTGAGPVITTYSPTRTSLAYAVGSAGTPSGSKRSLLPAP